MGVKTIKGFDETKDYTRDELEQLLEPWHITWAHEYVTHWNATEAYRTARGIMSAKPLTQHGANAGGYETKRAPWMQKYIKLIKDDIARNLGLSKQMIVGELMKLATSSMAAIHDSWITRKDFEELDDDIKAAIQEVSTKTIRTIDGMDNPQEIEYVKIKFYDKRAASADILKAMGWNEPEKQTITLQEKRVGVVNVRRLGEDNG